jgi:anaerobic magnesium-protoporphyrin IX monomethyl ester cyclase
MGNKVSTTSMLADQAGKSSQTDETSRSGVGVALVRGPLVSSTRAMNNEATPAVGLAHLAGYLEKHGYKVSLIDGIGEGLNKVWPLADYEDQVCQGLTFEEIVERIPPATDIIGISAMFSGEWPVQRDLVNVIRSSFPEALIVAGGEHITALSEYVLRDCAALDLCVRGEGEHTFFEIVEQVRTGASVHEVGAVSYLDAHGKFVENGALRRVRDLESIPWPSWPDGYLEEFWSAGKSFGIQSERDMPIVASRGCPYRCTFCSSPQMWTTRYILRDVTDVIEEIKAYKRRYDITSLQFYDLTAIMKKAWTIEFCEKLIEEGLELNWSLPSGTRSEALDSETLTMMKKTGCNYLVYAPESGAPKTLELISKRIDLDALTASLLEARKRGIIVRANLIIGFPEETRRDAYRTLLYAFKLVIKGVDEVSTNLFSPYPGSKIFRSLLEAKRIQLNDEYFFGLTSLNSDLFKLNPLVVHPSMSAFELAIYRAVAMLGGYALGYLLYPARIVRSLRNIIGNGSQTATVFEHRLKDSLKRRLKGKNRQEFDQSG